MKPRLASEVSSAYSVLENELEAKQSGPAQRSSRELVATAKKIERLQARRRKLRAELRRLDADIKHEKRFLRGLAGAMK